jgi:hypothetical protein
MWISSCQKYALPNSASNGSTSTARPASSRKPDGWFIHPLTVITISEPLKPAITTGIAASMCARGDRRFQP